MTTDVSGVVIVHNHGNLQWNVLASFLRERFGQVGTFEIQSNAPVRALHQDLAMEIQLETGSVCIEELGALRRDFAEFYIGRSISLSIGATAQA